MVLVLGLAFSLMKGVSSVSVTLSMLLLQDNSVTTANAAIVRTENTLSVNVRFLFMLMFFEFKNFRFVLKRAKLLARSGACCRDLIKGSKKKIYGVMLFPNGKK